MFSKRGRSPWLKSSEFYIRHSISRRIYVQGHGDIGILLPFFIVSEPHGSGNGEDVPLCVSFVRSALLFDRGNAKPYIFVAREPHWSNPPGVRQMADHAILPFLAQLEVC
jgi:hypothetical protein